MVVFFLFAGSGLSENMSGGGSCPFLEASSDDKPEGKARHRDAHSDDADDHARVVAGSRKPACRQEPAVRTLAIFAICDCDYPKDPSVLKILRR